MDSNIIMMTAAAILILVSAILYFIATFFGNAKKKSSSKKEDLNNQNELVVELKKQNALIQSRMESLEREIRLLSGRQENQVKTIIKYNKENARQLALSERDTLMRVMQELKKAIEPNAGSVVVKEVSEAAPVFEKVSDAELFEVSGLPADEEEPDLAASFAGMTEETTPVVPEFSNELEEAVMAEPSLEAPFVTDIPEPSLEELFATDIPETSETPEFSDELDLSSLFAEMEKEQMPIVAAEEPKQAAADPLGGFGSDPNAMMTPEDIAKLLEAMGQ